jgi:hypothetical protein
MNFTHKQQETTSTEVVATATNAVFSDQLDRNLASDGRAGDFIDETIAIWQKRTTRRLTREDGREIIENMTGFFRILLEWDRAERAAEQAKAIPNQGVAQQGES